MNLVLVLAAFAADPLPSPWDFEAQLKGSPTIQKMESDIAFIKANCVCLQGKTPSQTAAPGTSARVVRRADGSCVCQICDANGCREASCDCSALGVAQNATFPAGVAPGMVVMAGGGGCASGNCGVASYGAFASDGGCESGNCGSSSGRRGLFGRRRR